MNIEFMIFVIGILMMILAGCIISFVGHEQAHVQINKYAGVSSHVEWGLTGAITVNDSNFVSAQLREQAYIGHGFNEAIGYQLISMFIMLCSVIVICTIYLKD